MLFPFFIRESSLFTEYLHAVFDGRKRRIEETDAGEHFLEHVFHKREVRASQKRRVRPLCIIFLQYGLQKMAAAQLKHITPEAARARIEGAIDKYYASQKKGDVEGK